MGTDMTYRLVLKATFQDAEELDRVTQGLQQLKVQGAQVTVQMNDMKQAGTSSFASILQSGMSVAFMYNMLESAMMRQQQASKSLQDAEDNLTTTIQRYGAGSKEARDASEELKTTRDYLTSATNREYVSEGLMLATLIQQSGILKASTWATIEKTAAEAAHEIQTWATNTAIQAENTALSISDALTGNWYLLAAAAAVSAGVGIGAYAYNQSQQSAQSSSSSTSNININSNVTVSQDLDKALDKQNDEVKNEYKRMAP